MEREKSNNLRDHDQDGAPYWADSDSAERHVTSKSESEKDDYTGPNKDVSGNDKTDQERDRVRHHQSHGSRRYESFSNHSSADDQPRTDTGA